MHLKRPIGRRVAGYTRLCRCSGVAGSGQHHSREPGGDGSGPRDRPGLRDGVLDSYEAVGDVPIPVLYRELFARYDETTFLLVYRDASNRLQSVRWKLRGADFRTYCAVDPLKYFDWKPQRIGEITDVSLPGCTTSTWPM